MILWNRRQSRVEEGMSKVGGGYVCVKWGGSDGRERAGDKDSLLSLP